MAKDKAEIVRKKELPSLFCTLCREWVESEEAHNMFESIDGVEQKVAVWTCKKCRS
jgi:hypothetical protein